MNRSSRLCNLFCIVTCFAVFMSYSAVFCEIVQHMPCSVTPSNSCQIVSIAIDPCPEALENQTCNLYKGTNITWSFTFIPKFSGDKIIFQSYSHTVLVDIPYPGQDRNACNYTTCPFVSGEQRTVTYPTAILHAYPSAPFIVKWSIWNQDNNECCWLVPILIV